MEQDPVTAAFGSIEDYTELYPGAASDAEQLIIGWGRKGHGFGMLSFFDRDGVIECDNECMSRRFCAEILQAFATSMPAEDWPPMLKRFRGIVGLINACKPRHVTKDWARD